MRHVAIPTSVMLLLIAALSCCSKAVEAASGGTKDGGVKVTCAASLRASAASLDAGRSYDGCSQHQLVTITTGSDPGLRGVALEALGRQPDALGQGEVALLLRWMRGAGEQRGLRTRTAALIGRNAKHGVPLLLEEMQATRDPLQQVYCAGGLARQSSAANPELRKRATLVLLQALANPDESHQEAVYQMPGSEPWMAEWVLERMARPSAPEFLVYAGFGIMAALPKGPLLPRIHEVLSGELRHSSVLCRGAALDGLRTLGFDESDQAAYRAVAREKDPNVRRTLYAGLAEANAAWTLPLLIAGLRDSEEENRAACAYGLGELGRKESIPYLIALLRSVKSGERFGEDARSAGEAIVTIAGLKDIDFARIHRHHPLPNGSGHKWVAVDRQEQYRKAAAAVLAWWDGRSVPGRSSATVETPRDFHSTAVHSEGLARGGRRSRERRSE